MAQQPIMSVSGIRGIAGESLTTALYTAMAFIQAKECGGGRIIVGRDTRPSGRDFSRAAFRGIRLAGAIPVDIGIAPTPTTCFAVKHFAASGGIIITASHNPDPYNGYKMVHRSGRLLSGNECEALYEKYRRGDYPVEDSAGVCDDSPAETLNASAAHVEKIVAAIDAGAIRNAHIKIAIDAINGAAAAVFPLLLERLHVAWEGVHTGLDGNFVHNPEPRPEHLGDLAALLSRADDFWAGFAFDPDADRLAPLGEKGQPISEELTLALALETALSVHPGPVATNLSTSMVIDDVAAAYGCAVIRTKIGEAHVVEAMLRHKCRIGGEGNGGVIFPDVTAARDGLMAMGLILELMARKKMKISACAARYRAYAIIKEKIPLGDRNIVDVLGKVKQAFSSENVDEQDGLKIIRNDAWVHIRPSNTEPILRCIAEAATEKKAREMVKMVMDRVGT